MMQTLVGRAGFEAGLKLYFARHDGQAVTCDDFAAAMADANPCTALSTRLDAFKRWYAQAGTPRLTARGVYDPATQTYTLRLRQHPPATPDTATRLPLVIPVVMGLLGPHGHALPLRLQGEPEVAGATNRVERVLILEHAEQTFVFEGIANAPVPSLLRGFSAPAVLDDDLPDDALLVLMRHDSDPYNRWEAGQRLTLRRFLAALHAGQPLVLDPAFIETMRVVLTHPELDPAFKALALTLPEESYIAEQLNVVEPQAIHAAMLAAHAQLASGLRDEWAAAYASNQVDEDYTPGAASAGKRALANLALAMRVLDAQTSGDAVWPDKAYRQFQDADNMTERLGGLSALVNAHAEQAEPALAKFHSLFQDDALVVDKWFTLQARAPELDGRVFARAKSLLAHPDFNLKNPNRARSLLASLCMFNPAAFHRTDGAGYAFWVDQVLALDAINPLLASRLARAMDRWAQFVEPYRSSAREAVARVATKPYLSSDVREIIERALTSGDPVAIDGNHNPGRT